ncbi:hypothetical protein BB029_16755 [Pseudomonas sp. S3E12]|nr:hypothetical protein BB029_16755 [Pseudomonas sp. S3E12]
MKVQCLLNLSSYLIANAFGGVFTPKCTHLSRCFAQLFGDVSQAELSLCQDSSEILQSGI